MNVLFRQHRAARCPITLPPLIADQVIRAIESLGRNDARSLAAGDLKDEHAEIQLALAEGAANAASAYGGQQRWQEMAAARDELRATAGRFREHAEIQLELAKGAVNAAWHYGGQQRWQEMVSPPWTSCAPSQAASRTTSLSGRSTPRDFLLK